MLILTASPPTSLPCPRGAQGRMEVPGGQCIAVFSLLLLLSLFLWSGVSSSQAAVPDRKICSHVGYPMGCREYLLHCCGEPLPPTLTLMFPLLFLKLFVPSSSASTALFALSEICFHRSTTKNFTDVHSFGQWWICCWASWKWLLPAQASPWPLPTEDTPAAPPATTCLHQIQFLMLFLLLMLNYQ